MRIGHLALWASDIEALKIFYERYFNARANAKYSNERKHFHSYFLHFAEGATLEIMQRPDITAVPNAGNQEFLGYAHLAMALGSVEAVDSLTARLVADGYSRLDGPRWTGDGYYESVILDPEGNRIELTV
ncbi:MAG: VOC family protein [Caldilineaceae bacterium]|nr:VOC family protein [Caldilineaceae bacterium]